MPPTVNKHATRPSRNARRVIYEIDILIPPGFAMSDIHNCRPNRLTSTGIRSVSLNGLAPLASTPATQNSQCKDNIKYYVSLLPDLLLSQLAQLAGYLSA